MDNHIGRSLQRNPLIRSSQATGKRKLQQDNLSFVFPFKYLDKKGEIQWQKVKSYKREARHRLRLGTFLTKEIV